MSDKPNIDSLFAQAIQIETSEAQAEFAREACGDDQDLRRELEQLVEKVGDSKDPMLNYVRARAAAVSVRSKVDPKEAVRWAKTAVDLERRPWFTHVAALSHHRAGDQATALKLLDESASSDWHPELNLLARALVSHQSGDTDEAWGIVAEAQNWFNVQEKSRRTSRQATDWSEFNVLLKECKSIFDVEEN